MHVSIKSSQTKVKKVPDSQLHSCLQSKLYKLDSSLSSAKEYFLFFETYYCWTSDNLLVFI
jgi:hypothetical protein